MTIPGWYPDPSGVEAQLRFWDWRQWTAGVSQGPPVAGGPQCGSVSSAGRPATARWAPGWRQQGHFGSPASWVPTAGGAEEPGGVGADLVLHP